MMDKKTGNLMYEERGTNFTPREELGSTAEFRCHQMDVASVKVQRLSWRHSLSEQPTARVSLEMY